MSVKKDRVNIAVSKDVAERLAKIAEGQGMTQYALANQILSLGLDLIEQGYTLQQIREVALFFRVMTELESVPIPGRLLDKLIADMYRTNPEVVQKAWCEAGRMLASYIKAVFGSIEAAASLVPYISKIVPAKRFEVKADGEEFVMETIGVGYSTENVEATAKAVHCLLDELGYEIKESITAPGILKVKAVKK